MGRVAFPRELVGLLRPAVRVPGDAAAEVFGVDEGLAVALDADEIVDQTLLQVGIVFGVRKLWRNIAVGRDIDRHRALVVAREMHFPLRARGALEARQQLVAERRRGLVARERAGTLAHDGDEGVAIPDQRFELFERGVAPVLLPEIGLFEHFEPARAHVAGEHLARFTKFRADGGEENFETGTSSRLLKMREAGVNMACWNGKGKGRKQ